MRPIRDIRSQADLEEAVRRCELRWQALEKGEGVQTLLALDREQREAFAAVRKKFLLYP